MVDDRLVTERPDTPDHQTIASKLHAQRQFRHDFLPRHSSSLIAEDHQRSKVLCDTKPRDEREPGRIDPRRILRK